MKPLAILGASGHGKVVADAAMAAGWREIVFFDDLTPSGELLGWPIAGDTKDLTDAPHAFGAAVVAIGDNRTRLDKHHVLAGAGLMLATIAHPAAVVSGYATVGAGTVIFACAVVNASARLGLSCILNTAASVDHDCDIGDGVHVSPGARLGGGVTVGEGSWIGIGASVRHGVRIGANVRVGGGAMVITHVESGETIAGVPARKI